MPLLQMNFRRLVGLLLVFAVGPLLAQSGMTDSRAKAPTQQSEKPADDQTDHPDTMVGVINLKDQKAVFHTKGGSTWKISNPEMLKGIKGQAVEITGTFNAKDQTIHIQKASSMACGPRFCERQCKGKCGNGSACDCPRK